MPEHVDRRNVLQAGLAMLASPWVAQPQGQTGILAFRLRETAGLRRVAEPVSTVVPLADHALHLGLYRDGKAIPAQFRPYQRAGHPQLWTLDFVADLGPDETVRYEIHPETTIRASTPGVGMAIETTPDTFRLTRNQVGAFTVPRTLDPFLSSAGSPQLPFLAEPASRLCISLRDGEKSIRNVTRQGLVATIDREGPHAIGLRFAWTDATDITSELSLDFPFSRSLVAARWTVTDPSDRLESIGVDLHLRVDRQGGRTEVEPSPTPRWVRFLDDQSETLAVVAPTAGSPPTPELSLTNSGQLRLTHPTKGPSHSRTLAFWLAFDPASTPSERVTSPRALLRPIEVEWDQPGFAPGRF